MTEMNHERLDGFVEDYLRHVRGEGPPPDLSDLSVAEAGTVRELFAIVDALADSLPESPPIEDDPVAIRLGLAGHTVDAEAGDDDLIAMAVHDLSYRFPRSVNVEPVEAPEQHSSLPLQPKYWCRSLAETVIVLVYSGYDDEPPDPVELREWFSRDSDITAMALTSEDAQAATVVTFSECTRRLDPGSGWHDAGIGPRWEPLELALGRYFEQSIPRWDTVSGLPQLDGLVDVASDVLPVVAQQRSILRASRVQLEHKRQARDFVADLPDELYVRWVDQLRAGATTADEIAEEIRLQAMADTA